MSALRLAVFDCDGTLIDSVHAIISAMRTAFERSGLPAPTSEAVRGIVGLSVPEAVAALAPDQDAPTRLHLDQAFRAASIALRKESSAADGVLYPGAYAALERLASTDALLAVATGKARRGLEHSMDVHAMRPFFTATQSADDAPSKPHPGMLENCARLTGAAAADTIMIGDTTFDILMAKSYGCAAIGVSWGYHPVEVLRKAGADIIIDDFAQLDGALEDLWGRG